MIDEAIDVGPVVARLNELSLDCIQFSAYRVCQMVSVRRNYQLFDLEGCGPVGRGRAHPQLSRQ